MLLSEIRAHHQVVPQPLQGDSAGKAGAIRRAGRAGDAHGAPSAAAPVSAAVLGSRKLVGGDEEADGIYFVLHLGGHRDSFGGQNGALPYTLPVCKNPRKVVKKRPG